MCDIVLVEVLSRLTMRCEADVLCFVVRPASNRALAVKMALLADSSKERRRRVKKVIAQFCYCYCEIRRL